MKMCDLQTDEEAFDALEGLAAKVMKFQKGLRKRAR